MAPSRPGPRFSTRGQVDGRGWAIKSRKCRSGGELGDPRATRRCPVSPWLVEVMARVSETRVLALVADRYKQGSWAEAMDRAGIRAPDHLARAGLP